MKILLSPAKSLNLDASYPSIETSIPNLLKESKKMYPYLKQLNEQDIAEMMEISPKLASLNYERFQNLGKTTNLKRPAIYTFDGDVYDGIDFYSVKESQLELASQSIRILSGLYGILKPFDMIEPYRLEMGTTIQIGDFKNLYGFWGDQVTDALNQDLKKSKDTFALNLASQEYSKVVQAKKLAVPLKSCDFLENKDGKFKSISFFAKKARGLMTRFILDHQINRWEDLRGFDYENYSYNASLSHESKLIFTRG
jgi:cytoplasmic iron level regulating protein YaaA (DUF328/UPF0246 family)